MENLRQKLNGCEHRLSLHGQAVRIDSEIAGMNLPIHRALGEFSTPDWPDGFAPLSGTIQPYDESVVLRHLSPEAVAVAGGDELTELYENGERFWLVDDRWGLCEINLFKSEWRSWVFDRPRVSAIEVVESAVLWPMAQLLGAKRITLLPAVSLSRGGFGMMIISPYGIEAELTSLIADGWSVIGQRWTALRDDDGRIAMLRMPGAVERVNAGRQLSAASPSNNYVDLTIENPSARSHHAFCDAVLLVDPARRGSATIKAVRGSAVASSVRRAWPILELRAQPRTQNIATRLANECAVFEAQLSRKASDFVTAVNDIAATRVARPGKVSASVMSGAMAREIPA